MEEKQTTAEQIKFIIDNKIERYNHYNIPLRQLFKEAISETRNQTLSEAIEALFSLSIKSDKPYTLTDGIETLKGLMK